MDRFCPTMRRTPPEFLVLKGGGGKAFPYIGGARVLEQRGWMRGIKAVAGSSAGAIVGTFLALDYSADQIQATLLDEKLSRFLDWPWSKEALKKINKNHGGVKALWEIHKMFSGGPISALNQGLEVLWKTTGLFEADEFREWLDDHISKATGLKYCTFGELKTQIIPGTKFKDLHIWGQRINGDLKPRGFSTQDTECADLIISDIVRISMAFPGVFTPHSPYTMQFGLDLQPGDSNKELRKSGRTKMKGGSYVDGGMLNNLPITTFDTKRHTRSCYRGPMQETYEFNRRTLAFAPYSSTDKGKPAKKITSAAGVIMGVMKGFRHAEGALSATMPDSKFNAYRVVQMDVKDLQTFNISLSRKDLFAIVKVGTRACEAFLPKQIARPSSYFVVPKTDQRLPQKVYRPPHPSYVRRDDIKLDDSEGLGALIDRRDRSTTTRVLVGKGGQGKTELARAFAKKYSHRFSLIYWIDCTTPESKMLCMYRLAQTLDIPTAGQAWDDIHRAVWKELEEWPKDKDPWLLIFDNASRAVTLPKKGGSVLITSSKTKSWKRDKPIEVKGLSGQTGMALVKNILGRDRENVSRAVANQFEWSPLKIAIAATSMQAIGGVPTNDEDDSADKLPATLDEIFNYLSSDKVKHGSDAIACLHLLSYLSPESISTDWIAARPEAECPKESKGKELSTGNITNPNDVLKLLADRRLIRWKTTDNTLSISPTLQQLVRKWAKSKSSRALEILDQRVRSLHLEDDCDWERALEWFPHAARCLVIAKKKSAPEKAHITYALGCVKAHLGDADGAREAYETAIKHCTDKTTQDTLLKAKLKLAEMAFRQGCDTETVDLCIEALESHELDFPVIYARYGYLLGRTLRQMKGRVKDAHECLKVALKTSKRDDKKSWLTAMLRKELGEVCIKRSEYKAAVSYLKNALRATHLDNHPTKQAEARHQLGLAHEMLGELPSAIKEYEAALNLRKDLYEDAIHPDVADTLYHLGNCYREDRPFDAEFSYREALDIRKEIASAQPNSSEAGVAVANTYHALWQFFTEKGNMKEAKKNKKCAVELYKQWGRENPRITEMKEGIKPEGSSSSSQGKSKRARGKGKGL